MANGDELSSDLFSSANSAPPLVTDIGGEGPVLTATEYQSLQSTPLVTDIGGEGPVLTAAEYQSLQPVPGRASELDQSVPSADDVSALTKLGNETAARDFVLPDQSKSPPLNTSELVKTINGVAQAGVTIGTSIAKAANAGSSGQPTSAAKTTTMGPRLPPRPVSAPVFVASPAPGTAQNTAPSAAAPTTAGDASAAPPPPEAAGTQPAAAGSLKISRNFPGRTTGALAPAAPQGSAPPATVQPAGKVGTGTIVLAGLAGTAIAAGVGIALSGKKRR